MSMSHPSIVFINPVTKKHKVVSISVRPACPRCHQGSLTGQLNSNHDRDGFDTVCSNPGCKALVFMTEQWKVTGFSWKGAFYRLADTF